MEQSIPIPYAKIGGEEVVRALVNEFYDIMDSAPEAATIRAMHAKDLRVARQKLFMFMSGWLGGPELYFEKYGHPRMRKRHFRFSIGTEEAEEWMFCMEKAMAKHIADEETRSFLLRALRRLAMHMRNREE